VSLISIVVKCFPRVGLILLLFCKQIIQFYGIDLRKGKIPDSLVENRGYSLQKIQENNEAEIMQVVLTEAQESYKQDIIMILPSDNYENHEGNADRIVAWLNDYISKM
jgi:hypothetical protein